MTIAILGPQRLKPTLIEAVRALKATGRIATVTAGWQEREPDDAELHEYLGGNSYNLRLYQRAEQLYGADRELSNALHRRQDTLRQMQDLYRVRLTHTMAAARALTGRSEETALLSAERDAALEALRELDRQHLARTAAVHREFAERWRPLERPALRRHREEVGAILAECTALAIAGGHVAVLVNRLRLFDLVGLLGDKPVIAWSAGAMAVSQRVVLFHDSPPQGPGNAEVLETGLGWAPGLVPLPHAHRRLQLDDPERVGLLARRFAPASCVALDDGGMVFWRNNQWEGAKGAQQFGLDGSLIAGVAA